MKRTMTLFAASCAIAACNKGPNVELKNATGNEVASAVEKSGVMDGGTMVQPGLWQSKVTIQEMSIPGMPAAYAGKMKQMMAEHQEHSSKHCLSKEDVRKPKEGFFAGEDKSCRYANFTMGGGKIDIQMVCQREGTTQTTDMSGTYTPTSYSMDMTSRGKEGAQAGMLMKMHVDSQRIGECSGKGD